MIKPMSIDHNPSSYYAQRALKYAQTLARNPRGSATLAEKQAAEYTLAELKSMGVEDAKL